MAISSTWQSSMACTAINLHHFIVDRVIWRVRRDPNLRIVVGQAGTREALPGVSPALGLG
jgi:hypothetical protein